MSQIRITTAAVALLASAALPDSAAHAQRRVAPAPPVRPPAPAPPAPAPRPSGWLGLHYSAEAKIAETPGGFLASYKSYPVVEAVEPGSPAERAGLQAGDTLIAFDGYDFVKQGVPMARLLQPGRRIRVRVQRNRSRSARVTVGTRPAGTFAFARATPTPVGGSGARRSDWTEWEGAVPSSSGYRPAGVRVDVRTDVRTGATIRAAATAEAIARQTARVLEREIVMHPSVTPVITFGTPSGGMLVAGAEMVPVNAQLADALGVPQGVLLVNVVAGASADRAALRAGDVIVRAGSAEIADPAGLHMAMLHAGPAKVLALDVIRKGKAQKVVLRW